MPTKETNIVFIMLKITRFRQDDNAGATEPTDRITHVFIMQTKPTFMGTSVGVIRKQHVFQVQ